jgi:hypothetical protein
VPCRRQGCCCGAAGRVVGSIVVLGLLGLCTYIILKPYPAHALHHYISP